MVFYCQAIPGPQKIDHLTTPPQKTVAIVQTQAENAGAQEIARQLASGFQKRGWRTRQMFFFRRTESFDGEEDVFFCAPSRPASPLAVMKAIAALHREFRRSAPDAVVTLQHYGNVIAAPVARLAGAPIIVANQLSAPAVIPRPVALVDKWLGTLGAYDHIVVNSAQTEAAYRSYPGAYARRLARIDHGFIDKSVDIPKAEARARLGLPQDVTLLGCAARLCPLKQLDLAIALLTHDKRQHLALAGQGPDRERLEAQVAALNLQDRVHFLGELDKANLGALLAAIDCFVFPSAAETFGLAPVEAAQAGVAVVANDLPVLREVLAVDGAPCALFVDAANTSAFAAAVARSLNDPIRQSLTAAGRRLTQRYPLDAMIDQFMALIEGPTP